MKICSILLASAALFLASLADSQTNSGKESATEAAFKKYTISAEGIEASFISYGARITNLIVNDRHCNPQDVVLGYDDGNDYLKDTEGPHTNFGTIVGRYANRIKNGTFSVDHSEYKIPENENHGRNTLHGGLVGYDQRNWTVVSFNDSTITFSLTDYAYEGFPGNVISYATYSVFKGDDQKGPRLTSRLVSIPLDKKTPLMLSNHIYWNLNAFSNPEDVTILSDILEMPYSKRYIEIDNIEVPTGKIGLVNDQKTSYLDFLKPKPIGKDIEKSKNNCGYGCTGYDNAFIIDRPRYSGSETDLPVVLSLYSHETGIKLNVRTNQQSLQLYSCNNMDGSIQLKKSQQHGNSTTVPKYGCLVIETQQWIDAINNPQWGEDLYQLYSVDTPPAVVIGHYEFSIA